MRRLFFLLLVGAITGKPGSAITVFYTDYSAFQNATANLTVETFDEAPWANATLPSPLSNLGVTWTAGNNLFGSTYTAYSGALALSDLDGNPDVNDLLLASLPAGTKAAGAFTYRLASFYSIRMSAFDVNGDLIGTVEQTDTAWSFLGVSSDEGLGSVRFEAFHIVPGGDDFLLDNFAFSSELAVTQSDEVPEPSSGLPAGIALAAIRIARRCRRH